MNYKATHFQMTKRADGFPVDQRVSEKNKFVLLYEHHASCSASQ